METKAAGSLTHGRLGKQILAFSLPLMLSNVLQVLFNMSDIAVVGRFSGPIALGAVGSTATLVTLFTGFLIGLGSGINALVARFLGAGSREETQRTVHTALALSLIFGAVLLLLGELTAVPLLKLLGTKEELIDGATIYLRIYFLGMPAMALYNFGNAVLSAAGDTRRPLLYLLIAGILNVALNLFFVIVCGMSADGVALASILTQYLSSVLILIALVRTKDAYGVRPKCIRLHRDKLAPLLTLCCSAGLQNAIFAVANLFIQAGVNRFDALMVEGNSAAANADGLIYDVMAAFHTACASFIGQNYGAGNRDRVRRTYWISLSYSFAAGAVLGLSLVFFGRGFLALFTDSAEVAAAGMHRLCIMGFSYAISAFMDCTIAASRGLGRCVVPTIIVVLGSCVFRVIWVYTIFASVGTIASLYLLYPVSWTLTAVAEMVYFSTCTAKYSGTRRNRQLSEKQMPRCECSEAFVLIRQSWRSGPNRPQQPCRTAPSHA